MKNTNQESDFFNNKNNFSDIKAVIFDMDGVILDTETICQEVWQIAADELKLKDIDIVHKKCLGSGRTDTCTILKNHYGKDFDAEFFINRTSQLFFEVENTKGINLMPGVIETLEYLQKKYILALATSTRKQSAFRQLTNAKVIQYFKTQTFGDMVKHAKPDPEIYKLACSSIQIPCQNCLAIEDSPNGIKSAFNANLKPIMIPDKIEPDAEIKKMCLTICKPINELIKIL